MRQAPSHTLQCYLLLVEQRQHVLRLGVGLGQHRDTGLLQNLRPGQVPPSRPRSPRPESGCGTRPGSPWCHQVGDRGLEAVLDSTKGAAQIAGGVQCRVDTLDSVVGVCHVRTSTSSRLPEAVKDLRTETVFALSVPAKVMSFTEVMLSSDSFQSRIAVPLLPRAVLTASTKESTSSRCRWQR